MDELIIWENIENPSYQLEQYVIRNDESNNFE